MPELNETVAILRSTPAILRQLLGGLSQTLIHANYGPDTFSPFDVVGHLILGERLDWIPRARIILERGETRPFDPFPWDGRDAETESLPVGERLDVFSRLRAENVETLEAMRLTAADLARTGKHPNFGPVTLGQMLAMWGVHDLHHIAQVSKAVNYQFREMIGPWRPHVNSIPVEAGSSA